MSRPPVAVRLALWWVDRYTATAPEPQRSERRAELRCDVHDQLASGAGGRWARAIVGRTVRGLAADLAWRASLEARSRGLSWHLAHPASLLAALLTVLVPLGLLVDGVRSRAPGLAATAAVAAVLLVPLSACAVGVALVAAVRRCARPTRPNLTGLRRSLLATCSAMWALSYLWRFAPPPLETVSALAWAGVGGSLLAYLVACATSAARRGLDLGKIPS